MQYSDKCNIPMHALLPTFPPLISWGIAGEGRGIVKAGPVEKRMRAWIVVL